MNTAQAMSGKAAQIQVKEPFAVEARFYVKLSKQRVRCALCPRGCIVKDGERGVCGVRENRGGVYTTLLHGRARAIHVDPIEKKPLFHYLSGTNALSVGGVGCNLQCKFCQNWDLSRSAPEEIPDEFTPPRRVAALARSFGCPTIAYTYNEPAMFAEYLMEIADAGHEAGIRSIAVSNGYLQQEALREIYGKMDAVKIDLKAFSEAFYHRIAKGRLKPVLESLITLRTMNKWTEIVYLVIPMLNDSDEELRCAAAWIKQHLGDDTPLHFTRFYPAYKLKYLPVTPVARLERAKAIAEAEGLHYVYIGNVPGHPAQNTYCPNCRALLVERAGFRTVKALIGADGACPQCGHRIPGIWSA